MDNILLIQGIGVHGYRGICVGYKNFQPLHQFFIKLHRIRSPLAPLQKGGTGKTHIKVPLKKGDLGGSKYVQLHIKLVLHPHTLRLLYPSN
ncbi:hypothetical protein EH233_07290 [Anabaena sp. YBS01]|nr:hypothetical protein EH233_07290 [Anabaena sp. YBS01]QHD81660.1 hypothetical protein GSQ19_18640 [Trichormus variabilis 0441]